MDSETCPIGSLARAYWYRAVVLPELLPTAVDMDTRMIESRTMSRALAVDCMRAVCRRALALLPVGLALLPLPVDASEAWPSSVQARYRLRYNGIDIGHLDINSTTSAKTYALSGSGKVSAFFGAITWAGSSTVSGAIDGGVPKPATYAFDWKNNRKGGSIHIGFTNRTATEVAVVPLPGTPPDLVPLLPAHKTGVLDPVSALMMLTKSDRQPPCDRRVGIFDGKQRYDIVLTPKGETRLPAKAGVPPETAHVCRAMYEPVAGHRANAATTTYASNRDVEVVMRRIPGSEMVIPYSVTVPTFWGTGSMVTERIEITTATTGKIALTR